MKINKTYLLPVMAIVFFLPGCSVIAGIFEAGFWSAFIAIVIILALIIYGITKLL